MKKRGNRSDRPLNLDHATLSAPQVERSPEVHWLGFRGDLKINPQSPPLAGQLIVRPLRPASRASEAPLTQILGNS